MIDWNVIVTVKEHTFEDACVYLERFGRVSSTDYYNVLAMEVAEIAEFLENLRKDLEEQTDVASLLSHVIPVSEKVDFETPSEFERKAGDILKKWAPEIKGKTFHVRVHRRGFRSKMSSEEEERLLGGQIYDTLQEAGAECEVDFDDPDAIVAVEILGKEAGLSLWTREDLDKYPFLGLD